MGDTFSSEPDYDSAPLLGWGADQVPELEKLFEYLDQAGLLPTEFPGQTMLLPWLCK